MFVFRAAVVGAGTMGGEIAQAIASADVPVVLRDVDSAPLEQGLATARRATERQLRGLVKRERMTEAQAATELEAIIGRIRATTGYEGFGDVDLAIEAVPERMDVKHEVFAELDAATPGHAILASNTSGLSISELAAGTTRPDRVVGMHFFLPASVMRLVEVVEGEATSEETVQAVVGFAQQLRKQPIRCLDQAGFVVNRILAAGLGELWRAQAEEGLSFEHVDETVREAKAAPMGPFELSDWIGLDTLLHLAEHLREFYGERFHISAELSERVAAGDLGRKSGRGFYEHGG
ncbi:MAG: 3-hydroxyacyl-CoA dehydrogenase family protein [Thermoleophilaceae bacterium]|nr:3-hydroxyacyl-CoA dehydrogenase family protein [Thermoleophilaceae bacterium]